MVTAADGFLGSNLVRWLLAASYTVRAFLEPGRNTGTLEDLPVERWRAEILRLEDLSQAALRAELHRFVHVGSANSFEQGPQEKPGLEGALSGNTRYRLGPPPRKGGRELHRRAPKLVLLGGAAPSIYAPPGSDSSGRAGMERGREVVGVCPVAELLHGLHLL
jgi:hypothetical protein